MANNFFYQDCFAKIRRLKHFNAILQQNHRCFHIRYYVNIFDLYTENKPDVFSCAVFDATFVYRYILMQNCVSD